MCRSPADKDEMQASRYMATDVGPPRDERWYPMTSLAQRQLNVIDEQWQANHFEVKQCWEFEEFLLYCVEAFDRINRTDEVWRREVYRKRQSYNQEFDQEIESAYEWWFRVCSKISPALSTLEQKYGMVQYADRFRSCLCEAKGILTDDAEFFSGDALAKLRDEAINEHHRGETEDVGGAQ